MKGIKYIAQKLTSKALLRLRSKDFCPLIRTVNFSDFKPTELKNVTFDFRHNTTHLGDRLFFLPLLCFLESKSINIRILDESRSAQLLLSKLTGSQLPQAHASAELISEDDSDLVVLPAPSFTTKLYLDKPIAIVDLTDHRTTLRVSDQLLESFGNFLSLESKTVDFQPFISNQTAAVYDEKGKYFLFSNYVDSGRFRVTQWSLDALAQHAKKLKESGFKIVHVGTQENALEDNTKYDFIDIDERGKTDISGLIDLVRATNVEGCVSFDNFLMHLTGIHNKRAFIRFRGRFTQKARQHHFQCVNTSFFSDSNPITYL